MASEQHRGKIRRRAAYLGRVVYERYDGQERIWTHDERKAAYGGYVGTGMDMEAWIYEGLEFPTADALRRYEHAESDDPPMQRVRFESEREALEWLRDA